MDAASDVLVLGAGVIGAAVAWQAASRGLRVRLVDPEPGHGATWTAAGMLAPVTELHYGEESLLQLNLASARRYPSFVTELEATAGRSVGYATTGTVQVAWDSADLTALRDLCELQHRLGLSAELLTSRDLRGLEPALASGLPGGMLAADDHSVDNRALHGALLAAAERAGVLVVRRRAAELITEFGRCTGVRLDDGRVLPAGAVVLACGAWSRRLGGMPPELQPPVRPVKGQTLRLRWADRPLVTRVVRGSVKGSPVYVVPRASGEVVVGASAEEAGFDLRSRAGVVYELLRDAGALLPGLAEAEFVEVSTGLRPGSPDNAPVIGETGLPGLIVATGHYRNGVLLAPVTADAVADLLTSGRLPDAVAPFRPGRFRSGEPLAAEAS